MLRRLEKNMLFFLISSPSKKTSKIDERDQISALTTERETDMGEVRPGIRKILHNRVGRRKSLL